jgi:hypothetical protein
MSSEKPLIVDWKGLKRMGWPYSRTQTGRMMFDPDYAERRFPACRKLGSHRNSHRLARQRSSRLLRGPNAHAANPIKDVALIF